MLCGSVVTCPSICRHVFRIGRLCRMGLPVFFERNIVVALLFSADSRLIRRLGVICQGWTGSGKNEQPSEQDSKTGHNASDATSHNTVSELYRKRRVAYLRQNKERLQFSPALRGRPSPVSSEAGRRSAMVKPMLQVL